MRSCSSPVLVQETCGVKKLNRRPMAGPVNGLAVGPSAGVTGSDRRSPPPTTGTWACSGSMCGCSLSRGVPRFRQLLPARREHEFRGSVGTGVTNACSRAPTVRVGCLFGRAGSSWMTSPCSVVAGLSLTGAGARCGPHARSSKWSSSSDRTPGERRAYACSLRNCVQVGPIRRDAGPRPPRRSTVAMVVAELSTPSFRSSPLILR